MAFRTPTNPIARYIADLNAEQRSRLDADADLRAEFETRIAPFLPKPVGVSYGGMSGETWVPVEAVFGNAERAVRMARRDRGVAA